MKTKLFLPVFLAAICMLFLTDCKKEDDDGCYLTGTVSDYDDSDIYEGNLYIIFIDVDADSENDNHIKMLLGTWHGTEIQYSIDISDVTPGSYYLYMTMNFSGTPAGSYYLVGYYGGAPWPWDPPAAANVEVKCSAAYDFEVYD